MGRTRYKITDQTTPHFLTFTVLHWLPILTRPDTVDILLKSFRFLQADGLRIYTWVMLICQSIGVIRVHEVIVGWIVCLRFARNGDACVPKLELGNEGKSVFK